MTPDFDPSHSTADDAYERAVGLLARREHSWRELERKLGQRGYPADAIRGALERLLAAGYQSDARFGEMLVRSRVARAYGPLRIRAELSRHGLDDALIDTLLHAAEQDSDWLQLATDLLRRHYRGKPANSYRERGKRAQFLQRRGFPGSIAGQAIDRAGADNR